MATKVRRVLIAFLLSILFIQPVDAFAYGQAREATVWGHIYAAPASGKISTQSRPAPKRIEKKSTFLVKYTGFPKWAEDEFQAAADVWAENYPSDVPINIDATWTRMTSPEILGTARPDQFHSGFTNAPDLSLWYATAMANAISGRDLNGRNPELIIQVNSTANWYQGGPTGTITTREYDLQSVFLHEMAHGLGFLANDEYDAFTGIGRIDQPTPFEAYALVEDKRRLADLPSPSIELGTALTSKLVWSGPLGVAANNGEMPLLFTPSRYLDGSSISHLDDATFSKTGPNSVMTPSLEGGEIFHEPGPLLLAMMEDMRSKPPVGVATDLPFSPRNAQAFTANASALIAFDPPANLRTAQVTEYVVKNLKTGIEKKAQSSPVLITGLKNGTSYTFSVIARNSLGSSEPAITKPVIPQPAWNSSVLDSAADGKTVASTTFNGKPAIAYTDTKSGDLKLATFDGKSWKKITIDGAGGSSGRTTHNLSGAISMCVNGSGVKQTLHIFYTDATEKDLRYSTFNGKNFTFETVDGNGPSVNNYEDPIRVRTSSDVSVANACVASASAVQVFYRDESQGVLLGAVKSKDASWRYELVDGDRKTDGRTTGDVGFHVQAIFDGITTYVAYDSVVSMNQKKEITSGAIRIATRTSIEPTAWNYETLDISTDEAIIFGFDVALARTSAGVFATWLAASAASAPKPDQIRWSWLKDSTKIYKLTTENFGTPDKYLATDGKTIVFNCQERLCALDTSKKDLGQSAIRLVSSTQGSEPTQSAWVTVNKIKYLLATINGKLALLKP